MANPELQCKVCNLWIPCDENQFLVPNHDVKKSGVEKKCGGSRASAKAKRGFPKPNTDRWN